MAFSGIAIVLIAAGTFVLCPIKWVGVGMTVYGVIYFVVHDGMVHHRWPSRWTPKGG